MQSLNIGALLYLLETRPDSITNLPNKRKKKRQSTRKVTLPLLLLMLAESNYIILMPGLAPA